MDSRRWLTSIMAGMLSLAAVRTSAARTGAGTSDAVPEPARATAPQGSPVACDIMALDPAARKRHFDVLGPQLRARRQAVHELRDGYEFRLRGDRETVDMVLEWAAGERRCCPFFDIAIRMEREGGPLWLELTGREGVKAF